MSGAVTGARLHLTPVCVFLCIRRDRLEQLERQRERERKLREQQQKEQREQRELKERERRAEERRKERDARRDGVSTHTHTLRRGQLHQTHLY